jgi:hypothetical protein
MTKVLLFKPQFVDHVRSGRKLQTIRPPRKFPVHVGDRLSLRHWKDRPYASPQITILEATCTRVAPVKLAQDFVVVDHRLLTEPEVLSLARADGFEHPEEMRALFEMMHGLPFTGTLIAWGTA